MRSIVTRLGPEPEHDAPGMMQAFDEIVTGPVDSIHIERMSDQLYWMAFYRGKRRQVVVIGSQNGRAHVVGRTELEVE